MAEIPVGSPSGGGIAGIPTKYLLLGGGGIALALFLLNRNGGSPAATNDSSVETGQSLGPNAALALGDLQTRVLQESGELQEQLAGYFGDVTDQLDGQAAGLADIRTGQNFLANQGISLWESLMAESHEIRTGINTIINPAGATTYRNLQTQFQEWLANASQEQRDGLPSYLQTNIP